MKNRSVLKDGWEDVQGGSAIPKRCDLPHGDFLKFSLSPLTLSALSCPAPPEATFLCTATNFRRYITSYEYPMDIFGYAKLYIYIKKKSNVFLRDEALTRWIYFLRGSVRFLILSSDRHRFFETRSTTALLSNYSHLVITAKSAETQKRDTNVAGRIWMVRVKMCMRNVLYTISLRR